MTRFMCILTLVLLVNNAFAGNQFFRYEFEGELVISSSMPPEHQKLGYEIIDEQGRVIKTVEPALTEEMRSKLAEKDLQALEAEEEAERQAAYDKELLRKYSFVSDIEAERKRKVNELEVRVSILKGNLNTIRNELENEYAKAAEAERMGKDVPKKVKARIDNLEAQIISTENLLKTRESSIKELQVEYEKAISRLTEINQKKK